MYEVKVRSSFSAAHNLRNYRGKCEKVHGHNWIVEAAVTSEEVGKDGMVIDFIVLKKALKKVLGGLDHTHLNKLAYFRRANPSSENIAKYIYDKLCASLSSVLPALPTADPVGGCPLSSVKVWETENSCAEYRGE